MPETITISNAIAAYLTTLAPQYSLQTRSAYAQALHLFERVLRQQYRINSRKVTIDALSFDWACHYLHHLQSTCSVETEHLYSRAILAFYQHVQEHNHSPAIADNLAHYLLQHRRPKQHNLPQIPMQAVAAIIDYATTTPIPVQQPQAPARDTLRPLRDRAFLLLLATTGLRISETCNLRKAHINLPERTLDIAPTLQIPLSTTLATALRTYLNTRLPLDQAQRLLPDNQLPVLARHDKKAGKQILPITRWTGANIIKSWVVTALPPDTRRSLHEQNQPITPQTFRHYFVITTLLQTEDLATTRLLARHGSVATTRRYHSYTDKTTK